MAIQSPFLWGSNGQPISASEVARQRAIAAALTQANAGTPQNVGEGLNAIGRALAINALSARADEGARVGEEAYDQLFASLGDTPSRSQLIEIMGNEFGSEGEQSVVQALLKQNLDQSDPTSALERQMAQTRLEQAQLDLEQDRTGAAPTDEEFGFTMFPIENADGSITYGQPGNKGSFNIPELKEGAKFISPERAAYLKAYGAQGGKLAADTIDNLPSLIAKSDNMLATIDGIIADPALDSSTGWLSWMQAVPGTDQYRFGQRALQLQGQSFLQAFESLRGGGQITEIEGTKATQAIGRLSTAQKPEDYKSALGELKDIINAAKQRAKDKAAGIEQKVDGAPAPSNLPAPEDVDAILKGLGI